MAKEIMIRLFLSDEIRAANGAIFPLKKFYNVLQ
jgi:hypothetical protein